MSFLEELKKKIDERKSPVTVVNRGITPMSLLGVALIVLKVAGYITWSWWWVLAPFWLPVLIAIVLLMFIIVVLGIIVSKEPKIVQAETPKKKAKTKKIKNQIKKK